MSEPSSSDATRDPKQIAQPLSLRDRWRAIEWPRVILMAVIGGGLGVVLGLLTSSDSPLVKIVVFVLVLFASIFALILMAEESEQAIGKRRAENIGLGLASIALAMATIQLMDVVIP